MAAIYLNTDLQYIKGVGPKLAQVFNKRGIYKVADLLEFYPRAYEDRRAVRNISSLRPGELVSIKAQIANVSSHAMGRTRRKIYTVLLKDESGRISCSFFRVPYKGYFERFQEGQTVRVVGKIIEYRGRIQFNHPDIQDIVNEEKDEDSILPIYTELESISPKRLRNIFSTAINGLQENLPEILPSYILSKYNLISKTEALKSIHFPPSGLANDYFRFRTPSQRRIIFEEFFWLELILAAKKSGVKKESSYQMTNKFELINQFKSSLKFKLTNAQMKSFQDIVEDMKKSFPMHRMVQGDVGCGKTMVAMMAACYVVDHSFQAAIMVPTEILSKQHFNNAKKLLEPFGIKIALLTGNTSLKDRRIILESLKSGEIQICVGTHALIQEDVEFKNLALVVIDEQHRFGVEQRNKLKQKGKCPHFLLMTATPIPRTLAMTAYGDLDVSIIDEMPAGRIPILTRVVYESKREKVMGFMHDQIKKGRQAYIVFPLVEESEKMDLKDAVSSFESLKVAMPDIKFGLLHGKMKDDEKESIMNSFRQNEIQVLVSTTVIEVGVDVPNANMMIIEHTERFGLSQLHQLRGRVGRGEHKSYCVLMMGKALSDESKERAEIMASTSDGFKIAEADLELRGPGVFMGTKQSGLTGFQMANLVRDIVILQDARQAAFSILNNDPKLEKEEHKKLKEELLKTQGDKSLVSVG